MNHKKPLLLDKCPAGIGGEGLVNVTNPLSVTDGWSSSKSSANVNDDGIIDVTDLLAIVDAWGPCDLSNCN